MSNWSTRTVGDRTINLDRNRIPIRSSSRKPGPFPYYGASGIVDYVEGYLFEGLHLLVAEDGDNLRSRKTPVAFLADGQFWVNNHAHILLANDENDIRFLAYAIEASDVSAYITGSAQPKLNQSSLSSIPINAPSLEEQTRIAETLGSLDQRIESNKRAVHFALEILDGMSARVSATLPTVPLGSLVRVARDTVNPLQLGSSLVDHFSLPAFDQGARPETGPATAIMSNKLNITEPTILVSRLNPRFNRTWWVEPRNAVPALASTEFAPLTAGSEELLAGVWLAVRDEYFRDELARRVTGTSGSHQRVRPEDMLSIEVPDVSQLTPETKSEAFALLQLLQQKRNEIATFEALRDALLPELLTGRIRVPAAGEASA